jgi:hypothetical protein
MNLRQFVEPSLKTGGVLDGALSMDHCKSCGRVSVMGVHKICDEKNTDYGTAEVYWFELDLADGLSETL